MGSEFSSPLQFLQPPQGVIYSQALYCLDIVACTVPFWFRIFSPCLFFIFLSIDKYLRRNCTDKL